MSVQESLRTLDDVVKADVKVWSPPGPVVAEPLEPAVCPETGGQALLQGGQEALCAASVLAGGDRRMSRRPAG